KLRPGIKIHNGEDLNAEALKLNLDTYAGVPGSPQGAPLFSNVQEEWFDSTEIVDDLTVKVHINEPLPQYPSFLYGNGRVGIVAPEQLNAGDECATKLIG